MCSLRENDGIWPGITPWLGSLVVAKSHQGKGIGNALVEDSTKIASSLGFETIHLFAFDPTIPRYYQKLGWKNLGPETFKDHTVTVMRIDMKQPLFTNSTKT